MIFDLGDGMKRIDVPQNHVKNNLPLGTVLVLNGYDNPKFCIIKNLGLTPGFESYGAKYKVINIANGQESIKDTLGLDHISTKQDDRIKMYFTDTVLSADEIMDLIKLAEQKQAADIKAKAEADQAQAEELYRIKKDYAFLEPVAESGKSGRVIGAKNIRTELKRAFPGIKFSVTSQCFAGGDSIDVSWVDGPTTEEIDKILNKYEEGSFNGMEDIYEYNNDQFPEVYGGAKYVMGQRSLSETAYNKAAKGQGYPDAVFNPKSGQFDNVPYEINEQIKREAWKTKFNLSEEII